MIRLKFLSFILVLFLFFFGGCTGKKVEKKQNETKVTAVAATSPEIGKETLLLLKDLEENGDYVNSQFFPSLIKASVVYEELGGKDLVIDLRSKEKFSKGHIKGAVNKKFEELPEYLETGIKPFEYDKIILTCDDGQVSSYTTSLLRLMGYGNIFAMRWGMSGWNKAIAEEEWLKGLSGSYEDRLEVSSNEIPPPAGMPEIKTGFATGKEIGDSRFKALFAEGTHNILVTSDEVFKNPQKYFIINLERKDKYDNGHIPGAIRYKPESTLGFTDMMSTIPFNKTVVIYCGTGHNSGFATAFLRLFGYDAKTLKYGNNSFMFDKMVKQKSTLSWLPFSLTESNDFALVK
jgi:rhodanese-related sulfurtransferase